MTTKKQRKPRCGKGQSCGWGCIEARDTCRETIDADVAARLVAVATAERQPSDAQGRSYDEVAKQFPPRLLAAAHAAGVTTRDLGGGVTLTTKVATGLDGSTVRYGFVTDSDGRRYTVSDGLVKEVTSGDKGAEWNEAFQAAVRSKVAVAPEAAKAPEAEIGNLAEKFSTKREHPIRKEQSATAIKYVEANLKQVLAGVELRINVEASSLLKILDSGRFKSQFETGTSNGVLDTKLRAEAESKVLSYETDSDPKLRPIYGSLVTPGTTNLASIYGGIAVILKPEVRSRTTFTVQDSLNASVGGGTPINEPRIESDIYSTPISKLSEAETTSDLSGTYVEAQYHGGVSVKDIAFVRLPKDRELYTEALLAALASNKISVKFA